MDKEERSPEDGVGTRNPESEFRSPVRSDWAFHPLSGKTIGSPVRSPVKEVR